MRASGGDVDELRRGDSLVVCCSWSPLRPSFCRSCSWRGMSGLSLSDGYPERVGLAMFGHVVFGGLLVRVDEGGRQRDPGSECVECHRRFLWNFKF